MGSIIIIMAALMVGFAGVCVVDVIVDAILDFDWRHRR